MDLDATQPQLREEVRRIKAAELPYRPEDLTSDFRDHARAFDFDAPEAYAEAARHVVRSAHRILAQEYAGELQFLFFEKQGYVVVDSERRIRGYFEHRKPGAVEKAFKNLRKKRVWVRMKHIP